MTGLCAPRWHATARAARAAAWRLIPHATVPLDTEWPWPRRTRCGRCWRDVYYKPPPPPPLQADESLITCLEGESRRARRRRERTGRAHD